MMEIHILSSSGKNVKQDRTYIKTKHLRIYGEGLKDKEILEVVQRNINQFRTRLGLTPVEVTWSRHGKGIDIRVFMK